MTTLALQLNFNESQTQLSIRLHEKLLRVVHWFVIIILHSVLSHQLSKSNRNIQFSNMSPIYNYKRSIIILKYIYCAIQGKKIVKCAMAIVVVWLREYNA